MNASLRARSIACLSVIGVSGLFAQDCSIPFTTPQFGVQQELDILYGSAVRYNGATQELRLNLFKPVGDGQTQRPLIILIHGGGFTGGDRADLNAMCQDLASKGWAAATISYRLDFYGTWLLSSPWAYDPAEVIRAAYRAQQDARGAIRFLKVRSAMDSTSTTNVMLMGFSAGAIAALHVAYVDVPSEKPASCGAIGNVVHFLTQYPRPDLGPIGGTLNLNGMTDKVLAVASNYGGLLDTTLVSGPLDPALYMYHQSGDPVVGCNYQKGLWGMPLGVGDNYPYLYGSCVIDTRVQHLNPAPGRYLYHPYIGNEHAVHDPAGILLETTQFLRDLFCSPQVAGVSVAVRVLLEGPYDASTGLMGDPLRSLGGFPLTEPYTAMGYVPTGGGGNEYIQPTVLNTTGANAVVDWVVLELRDRDNASVVLASRSALVQRDGDVVDVDGTSPVSFGQGPNTYYVAVRHRNHLGAMTANAIALSATPANINFTTSATTTYGTEARKSVVGVFPAEVLWAGNVDFNNELKYTGSFNDRDPILLAIGGSIPTAVLSGQYRKEDVNMDGVVKYIGANNDRDPILENIGGSVPTNTRVGQLP
ncbi:MAG: carboxylesterase family protein [Flavobacteriales bacterium]|nr:carboxylesterase family protein [Flavobacteriales bacterium]